MAAVSMKLSCLVAKSHELGEKARSAKINTKTNTPWLTLVCRYESSRSEEEKEECKVTKDEKMEKRGGVDVLKGVVKIGKTLKANMSPKQKGDWKDLVLMSLSFAVYVYVSQRIVCAYCVWTSMLKHQPW